MKAQGECVLLATSLPDPLSCEHGGVCVEIRI